MYKILPDFAVFQVYDLGKPIVGAEEWFNSSGRAFIYMATRTELHRKEIPGRSDWNDVDADSGWPKTNLTAADWHTMAVSGGSLIIANTNTLALVGYDDSYTNDAVDLIPGNIAKTIVERNGRTIAGTYRASDPNKGINAAIDSEYPLSQVGDNGDIFYANMTDSIPVKRFPGGGKVNPGGVANVVDQVNFFEWEQDALSWIDKQSVGNMALFGVYGATSGKGGIYSLGRKYKNHPFVMNLEYLLDEDEIGAIVNTNGITYVSYRSGSDFGVKVVDLSTKAVGTYEGLDFKAPIKQVEQKTEWGLAELFMAPLPSGASVEFWYKINKTGSFIQAKAADGSTSFTTVDGMKATFIIKAEGDIIEPRIVLNPIGNITPEVYRIRIYFD